MELVINTIMQIIINPAQIGYEKFESFVYNHPIGNFFQSTKAYYFSKAVDNYESILIAAEANGEIVGSLLSVIIREGNGIKVYIHSSYIVRGGRLPTLEVHARKGRVFLP